jgi:tRNA-splicing ligase RtcB
MEYLVTNVGKTVDAKVFLDKMMIDKGTMSQIKYMVEHPSINHVRIMPDCHRGNSCCIGFTSKLTDKIVPSYVGVDIGCGIISYNTERKLAELGLTVEQLEEKIRQIIPMGTLDNCVNKNIIVKDI